MRSRSDYYSSLRTSPSRGNSPGITKYGASVARLKEGSDIPLSTSSRGTLPSNYLSGMGPSSTARSTSGLRSTTASLSATHISPSKKRPNNVSNPIHIDSTTSVLTGSGNRRHMGTGSLQSPPETDSARRLRIELERTKEELHRTKVELQRAREFTSDSRLIISTLQKEGEAIRCALETARAQKEHTTQYEQSILTRLRHATEALEHSEQQRLQYTNEITALREEAHEKNLQVTQLQSMHEQTLQRLNETMTELSKKTNSTLTLQRECASLQGCIDRKRDVESSMAHMDVTLNAQKEEIARLRRVVDDQADELRERDRRMSSVEDTKRMHSAAEVYIAQMQEDLRSAQDQNGKLRQSVESATRKRESLEEELVRVRSLNASLQKQVDHYVSSLHEHESHMLRGRKETNDAQDKQDALQRSLEVATEELSRLRSKIVECERQGIELVSERDTLAVDRSRLEHCNRELAAHIEELEELIEQRRKESTATRPRTAMVEQELEELRSQHDLRIHEVGQLQIEIRQLKALHDAEVNELRAAATHSRKQLHALRLQVDESSAHSGDAEQEVGRLRQMRDTMKTQVDDLRESLRTRELEAVQLRKELQEARMGLEDLTIKHSGLEMQIHRLNAALFEARTAAETNEAAMDRHRRDGDEMRERLMHLETQNADLSISVATRTKQVQQLQADLSEIEKSNGEHVAQTTSQNARLQSTLSGVRAELEAAQAEKQRLISELSETKGRLRSVEIEHGDRENQRAAMESQQQSKRQLQENRAAIRELEHLLETSQSEAARYRTQVQQLERQVNDHKEMIREKEVLVTSLRRELQEAHSEQDIAAEEQERLAVQLSRANSAYSDLKTKLQDAEDEVDRLRQLLQQTQSRGTDLEHDLEEVQRSLEVKQRANAQTLSELQQTVLRLETELSHAQQQVTTLKKQHQDAMHVRSELEEKLEREQQEANKLRKLRETTQEEIDSLRSQSERSQREMQRTQQQCASLTRERDRYSEALEELKKLSQEEWQMQEMQLKRVSEALEKTVANTSKGKQEICSQLIATLDTLDASGLN